MEEKKFWYVLGNAFRDDNYRCIFGIWKYFQERDVVRL